MGKGKTIKKRPSAEDRDLADVFRKMSVGKYYISVENQRGQAHLKPEGGFVIFFPNKIIIICPEIK